MTRNISTLLIFALAGCQTAGGLRIGDDGFGLPDDTPTDSDSPSNLETDVDTGESGPSSDTDGDTNLPDDHNPNGPSSFGHCAPLAPIPADGVGQAVYQVAGHATLTGGSGSWPGSPATRWEGCEVERHFDDQGRFVCETERQLAGDNNSALFGSWEYPLTFTVVAEYTSCTDAQDFAGTYKLDNKDSGKKTWRLLRKIQAQKKFFAAGVYKYTTSNKDTTYNFDYSRYYLESEN